MRPRRTLAHRRVLQRVVGEVEVAALERRWLVRRMGPYAFGHAGGRCADFGRNALQTASWVSTYGPPMRSRQYGTAGKTPSSVSLIAFGWPGRFKISARQENAVERFIDRFRLARQIQDQRPAADDANLARQV